MSNDSIDWNVNSDLSSAAIVSLPVKRDVGLVEFQYAGFARRLAAFILDFVVVVFLQVVVGVPILVLLENFFLLTEARLDLVSTVICVVVSWQYYALMECSKPQATLGKLALGIKVVDLRGNRIGILRATARFFGKLMSSVGFIGFFIIDFTKQKQGMHDMAAGCLVVRRECPRRGGW